MPTSTKIVLPNTPLADIFRLTPLQKTGLTKLAITSVYDLLYYFPTRYSSISEVRLIRDLVAGEQAIVYGRVLSSKTSKGFRSKIPMTEAVIEDSTGKIKAVWFHQAYIAKILIQDSMIKLAGKVEDRKGVLYLANPELEKTKELPIDAGHSLFGENTEAFFYPVYPETKGITSKFLYHHIQKVFGMGVLNHLTDHIPDEILKQYNLPSLRTALIWIHTPHKENDAKSARKRFAFEEVFMIQLARQRERAIFKAHDAFTIDPDRDKLANFIARFPFTPTSGQTSALNDILGDFKKGTPMARLLEGDVGSGKTFVAAAAAYAVVASPTRPAPASLLHSSASVLHNSASYQVAYMAPTEILAEQHFKSFIEYFRGLPIEIGLVTGSGAKKFPSKVDPSGSTKVSKAQLLKWAEEGTLPILIGTHSLIQKSVKFKNLALAIVDEQHRFGVSQRGTLARGTNAERTRKNAEDTTRNYAEQTQNNAKGIQIDLLLYRDLTYKIRNALFAVKKELGGGHKESVYQKAIAEEFERLQLKYSSEVRIPIDYKDKNVGVYIPDFVVDDKIIIELKAISFVGSTEKNQTWSYLKGSKYTLALLVNYGHKELTIDRIVYDTARSSASVPQNSAFVPHRIPHFLSMTATPIPRTLALTIYGNLDLTVLDEMPSGRLPIKTELITPSTRKRMEEEIRAGLREGRQAFIICPRIDLPDPEKELALNVKSVKEEARRLKEKVFQEFEIEILHGKMLPTEKEKVMGRFEKGETHILVATSVVEVGVNVPNATMIVIEGAERFGLAQLHQLRGRVMRSSHQPYCYLLASTSNETSLKRLKALVISKSGFELAEQDLLLRGSGELGGSKQWGISDLGMEAIKNIKMVEAARTEAHLLITEDSELLNYPLLLARIYAKEKTHFE